MHPGLGGRLLKCVEIYDDHVDRLNAVFGHGRAVSRIFASMQDSTVNLWMQRLHSAVEHLWEPRQLRDVLYRNARIAQQLCRAPSRNQLDPHAGELARKLREPRLIGDTEHSTLNVVRP